MFRANIGNTSLSQSVNIIEVALVSYLHWWTRIAAVLIVRTRVRVYINFV